MRQDGKCGRSGCDQPVRFDSGFCDPHERALTTFNDQQRFSILDGTPEMKALDLKCQKAAMENVAPFSSPDAISYVRLSGEITGEHLKDTIELLTCLEECGYGFNFHPISPLPHGVHRMYPDGDDRAVEIVIILAGLNRGNIRVRLTQVRWDGIEFTRDETSPYSLEGDTPMDGSATIHEAAVHLRWVNSLLTGGLSADTPGLLRWLLETEMDAIEGLPDESILMLFRMSH